MTTTEMWNLTGFLINIKRFLEGVMVIWLWFKEKSPYL